MQWPHLEKSSLSTSLRESPPPKPSPLPSIKLTSFRKSSEGIYAEIDEDDDAEKTPTDTDYHSLSNGSNSKSQHFRFSEVYLSTAGSDSGNGSRDSNTLSDDKR